MRKAFDNYDQDGSGSITPDEIRLIFGGAKGLSDAAIDKIIEEFDENGDGEI